MNRRNVIIALILFWAVILFIGLNGYKDKTIIINHHLKNLQWGNDTISNLYLYWYDSCGVSFDGRILDIDNPNDKMLIDLFNPPTRKILYRGNKFDTIGYIGEPAPSLSAILPAITFDSTQIT